MKLKLTIDEIEKLYREEYTTSEEYFISNDQGDDRTYLQPEFDEDGFKEFWKEAKPFFEKGEFVIDKIYNISACELVGFGYGLSLNWFEPDDKQIE